MKNYFDQKFKTKFSKQTITKVKDLRNACVRAFNSISSHVTSIKQEFEGTKQFEPMQLKAVLEDKVIYLSKIDENR